jgi:TonB family protein
MLILFLTGCGENSKGPDQQVNPSSASGVTGQETPPPDYLPVDKEPTVLKKVNPQYPELALKSGLEGKVWVKIWVGSDGTPKQVVILKSDSDVFNQVSIDAAKQFLFTPAYIKDKPVDCWVSVPFKYKLAEKSAAKPEEVSFMRGYISAKESAVAALEKEQDSAQKSGKRDPALQQKIQKARTELQALKDAMKAMQVSK